MKKALVILAVSPLICWVAGMMLMALPAAVGSSCTPTGASSFLCTLALNIMWGGFAPLFLIYTVPAALGIGLVWYCYKKFIAK